MCKNYIDNGQMCLFDILMWKKKLIKKVGFCNFLKIAFWKTNY